MGGVTYRGMGIPKVALAKKLRIQRGRICIPPRVGGNLPVLLLKRLSRNMANILPLLCAKDFWLWSRIFRAQSTPRVLASALNCRTLESNTIGRGIHNWINEETRSENHSIGINNSFVKTRALDTQKQLIYRNLLGERPLIKGLL